jgi:biotin carboxyl carrier protein
VFVPMLEETSFHRAVPGRHRPVLIWWCVSVAIGIGVLFKRKTIGRHLPGHYVCIAPVLAVVRSGTEAAHWCRPRSAQRLKARHEPKFQGSRDDNWEEDFHRDRDSALGAVVGANIYYRRDRGVQVATEAIRSRDLEAIVSASGKIQPKRQVNISANTMGKVTRLAVEEGQRVKAGQFLLEIDPRSLAGQLERGEASVAAAQSSLQGNAPRSNRPTSTSTRQAEPQAPAEDCGRTA